MKTDQFYSVKTLADKLALTPTTIYRLVDHGKLPAIKIGKSIRFKPADIDAFLETVRVGPGGLADDQRKAAADTRGFIIGPETGHPEIRKDRKNERRKSRQSHPGQD